jgi:hypothetical protein
MTRRPAVPTLPNVPTLGTTHHAQAVPIMLPTDWSPEQAAAVFEILDELREQLWARYGLQIQQVLREQRTAPITAAPHIDDADVPF